MRLSLWLALPIILFTPPAFAAPQPCQSIVVAPVALPADTALIPVPSSEMCADYPIASAQLEENGTALLDVQVLANGSIGTLKVAQSSGKPRLDSAALRIAKQRVKFRLTNGTAAPVTRRISIAFKVTTRPRSGEISPPSEDNS